ncbi:hypothetical protein GQ43DRAFT_477388 [Delitschia confertaspora ATCC 74209]|uniref:SPT23/MGA2-like DNA-binding domain-containing protein n=1 Tax=Delitschia confertaspora ATCC 74209 TaxID=1513339 RepID=A0A9P4MTL2_9PLEO|nr:hypothetical protein GQ43DRAFT_477388 [Delitschia confertaspora ATCC 74209]
MSNMDTSFRLKEGTEEYTYTTSDFLPLHDTSFSPFYQTPLQYDFNVHDQQFLPSLPLDTPIAFNFPNFLPEDSLLDPGVALAQTYPLSHPVGQDPICPPLNTSRPAALSHVDSAVGLNAPSVLTTQDVETPQAYPLTTEPPQVYLVADKTKTRAETQIKMRLVFDPLSSQFERIRFPKKTLAKAKLFASEQEKAEYGKRGTVVMHVLLVLATAVESDKQRDLALKRARGDVPMPRRPSPGETASLDKDHPAHPLNGGEVVICQGCKEREEKRANRKKKREDEGEWEKYSDERVILINEKEFKPLKEPEGSLKDHQFSQLAKEVEFAMRIACYCRHQEEKTPAGYRVLFTFKDSQGKLLAQHISEIFQITDDHKNKEVASDMMGGWATTASMTQPFGPTAFTPTAPMIPEYSTVTYSQPSTPMVPAFPSQLIPTQTTYPTPSSNDSYSQPTTPMAAIFPTHMFTTKDSPFATPPTYSRQSSISSPVGTMGYFPIGSSTAGSGMTGVPASGIPAYAESTLAYRSRSFMHTPGLTGSVRSPDEGQYLPRAASYDTFNFQQMAHDSMFVSAPQSPNIGPLSESRPASPSWDQGRPNKKKRASFQLGSLLHAKHQNGHNNQNSTEIMSKNQNMDDADREFLISLLTSFKFYDTDALNEPNFRLSPLFKFGFISDPDSAGRGVRHECSPDFAYRTPQRKWYRRRPRRVGPHGRGKRSARRNSRMTVKLARLGRHAQQFGALEKSRQSERENGIVAERVLPSRSHRYMCR